MDGKRIQCLLNPSHHVPIYLQQFPSYSNRKCKKSPFSRTAARIFVCPGDAPAIITQYVAWMEKQLNACQTTRSMYLSIFNSFRVIRCLSQCVSPKIAVFTYCSPHFCFPWRCPCDYHAIFAWIERRLNACQTPRSMYLSVVNSFRVIRCLNQCISPKIAIFTTFLFPQVTPLGQSRYMLYGWKENSMLTNCLTACTNLSSTVSELFEPQVQKNRRFHVPQPTFLFPLETPLRLSRNVFHGWKDNSMLAKTLAASTYLSSIVSELYDA